MSSRRAKKPIKQVVPTCIKMCILLPYSLFFTKRPAKMTAEILFMAIWISAAPGVFRGRKMPSGVESRRRQCSDGDNAGNPFDKFNSNSHRCSSPATDWKGKAHFASIKILKLHIKHSFKLWANINVWPGKHQTMNKAAKTTNWCGLGKRRYFILYCRWFY